MGAQVREAAPSERQLMKIRVNDLDTGDEWRDFEKVQNDEYDEESEEVPSPALPAAPSEKLEKLPDPKEKKAKVGPKLTSEIGVQSAPPPDDSDRRVASAGGAMGRGNRRPKTARALEYKARKEPTWDESASDSEQQNTTIGSGLRMSAKKRVGSAARVEDEDAEGPSKGRTRRDGPKRMVNAEQQTSETEEEEEDRREAVEKLLNERKLKRMKQKTQTGKWTISDDGVLKEIPLNKNSTLQVYIKSTSDFSYF